MLLQTRELSAASIGGGSAGPGAETTLGRVWFHLNLEDVPDRGHVFWIDRPSNLANGPSISGFTDQKSPATLSVLSAPRTGGRIDDHD